jgi:hypothetical protein
MDGAVGVTQWLVFLSLLMTRSFSSSIREAVSPGLSVFCSSFWTDFRAVLDWWIPARSPLVLRSTTRYVDVTALHGGLPAESERPLICSSLPLSIRPSDPGIAARGNLLDPWSLCWTVHRREPPTPSSDLFTVNRS